MRGEGGGGEAGADHTGQVARARVRSLGFILSRFGKLYRVLRKEVTMKLYIIKFLLVFGVG